MTRFPGRFARPTSIISRSSDDRLAREWAEFQRRLNYPQPRCPDVTLNEIDALAAALDRCAYQPYEPLLLSLLRKLSPGHELVQTMDRIKATVADEEASERAAMTGGAP